MASRTTVRLSGALAIAGGLLMLFGGVVSHSITLSILPILKQEIVSRVPTSIQPEAVLAIDVIALLVSLGAIGVILGGVFLLFEHKSVGRLLIALAGAAGLIGLVLALGYYIFVNGIAGATAHAGYWLGFVLAVVARRISK